MKCIIGIKNIRNWAKALQTLIQTGDTTFSFTITSASLIISSLDPSALSHIKFCFFSEFFTDYTFLEQLEELSFKVPVKCILKPFQSLRFLKTTSHIELKVANNSNKLDITTHKKWGSKVNYSILFSSDEETYLIDCEPSSLKSCLRTNPKLICEGLNFFAHGKGISHIVFRATKDLLTMKNTITELVKTDGKVFTELGLNSLDFHEYNVSEDIEIIFSMREFKSFIQFCETVKLPISIHFESPQKPLIVCVASEDYYESTMTLAAKEVSNPEFVSQSTHISIHSTSFQSRKRSGRVGIKTFPLREQKRPKKLPTPTLDNLAQILDEHRAPKKIKPRSYVIPESFPPLSDISEERTPFMTPLVTPSTSTESVAKPNALNNNLSTIVDQNKSIGNKKILENIEERTENVEENENIPRVNQIMEEDEPMMDMNQNMEEDEPMLDLNENIGENMVENEKMEGVREKTPEKKTLKFPPGFNISNLFVDYYPPSDDEVIVGASDSDSDGFPAPYRPPGK